MSLMYNARVRIDTVIKERNLPVFVTRGQIGMKAGMVLTAVTEDTPDDPEKLQKLRQAAMEVLKVVI